MAVLDGTTLRLCRVLRLYKTPCLGCCCSKSGKKINICSMWSSIRSHSTGDWAVIKVSDCAFLATCV